MMSSRSLLALMKGGLSLGLLIMLSGCVASPPRDIGNICQIFEDRRSWYKAAKRTHERWGVPEHVSMAILYQESAFRGRARPPRARLFGFIPWRRPSSAYGYAQALDMTWNEYKSEAGGWAASRASFSDAIDFVGWYSNHSNRRNDISRYDTYNLYLAYHEGHGGFNRKTYANKPGLLSVSRRVQANADIFQQQYLGCQQDLSRNWFMRVFF